MSYKIKQDGEWINVNGQRLYVGTQSSIDNAIARGELVEGMLYACIDDYEGEGANIAGMVQMYAGSTPPDGWLICDGSAISRTEYSALFEAIGTIWGNGDGSTTFNIPDMRGKFAEGTPNGGTLGASIAAGLPNITGNLGYLKALDSGGYYQGYNTATGVFKSSQNQTANPAATAAKSADSSTNASGLVVFKASDDNSIYGNSSTVQPPAVCINYIIKY